LSKHRGLLRYGSQVEKHWFKAICKLPVTADPKISEDNSGPEDFQLQEIRIKTLPS